MQCNSYEAAATCNSPSGFETAPPFKVVVVGHVDHGKSTLLGRWLLDDGRVAADQISKVEKICAEKGLAFEPAFLLDAFEEEHSQGISIDTTRAQLNYNGRKYLFIDVPGHIEFIKNMASGASHAELGILVLDALEGVQPQTSQHLKILAVLGVVDVVVVINKMDKIGYNPDAFWRLKAQVESLLDSLNLQCISVVPISALSGENVLRKSEKTLWYDGGTLVEAVSAHAERQKPQDDKAQFRMILQDVYKFNEERYFVGRVLSGSIRPGNSIFFSPSGKASKVLTIAKFPDMDRKVATKGESIAIKLTDQIYVERGEIVSPPDKAPETAREFAAIIVWVSADPLCFGSEYLLKIGTAEVSCSLNPLTGTDAEVAGNGEVLDVLIKLSQPIAFDRTAETGGINKFVLCSAYDTVAAGVIQPEHSSSIIMPRVPSHVQREGGYLDRVTREEIHGHKGTVLWLTGLSGAGKSSLAKALEKTLYAQHRVLAVDADTMRTGLCADLGFTAEERTENIRRIAQLAAFASNLGFIVLVSCLSPYRRDREMARIIIGAADFHEVFISCPLEICQSRDPKGLYRKAAQGSIKSFTGLDSPYQIPLKPALSLDSSQRTLAEEVDVVLNFLRHKTIIQ